MNKSVIETLKRKPPTSIGDRNGTSLSMQYKKFLASASATDVSTPSHQNNIDKLIRDNLKKNKEKELVKEIEEIQVREDLLLKKDAILKLNENVRKANKQSHSKKRNHRKNLTLKLSTGEMKTYKLDKTKIALSTKGSFVQEFKKIRKEIEEELKKEDMKYNKSRIHTACASPKNMTNSMISRPDTNKLQIVPNEFEEFGKGKKSIRKFMKQKKRKYKKDKLLERSQEFKRHFKVKENLKVLNKHVKHIRTHSLRACIITGIQGYMIRKRTLVISYTQILLNLRLQRTMDSMALTSKSYFLKATSQVILICFLMQKMTLVKLKASM